MIDRPIVLTDGFHLIQSVIAKYLADQIKIQRRDYVREFPSEQWKYYAVKVFTEHSEPWSLWVNFNFESEEELFSVLNVKFTSDELDSARQSRDRRTCTFTIEAVAIGLPQEDNKGGQVKPDTDAAKRSQLTAFLAAKILRSGDFNTLLSSIGATNELVVRGYRSTAVQPNNIPANTTAVHLTELEITVPYEQDHTLQTLPSDNFQGATWQILRGDSGEILAEGETNHGNSE